MEHGAGSKEQGAGSREQGAGSREQGAGSTNLHSTRSVHAQRPRAAAILLTPAIGAAVLIAAVGTLLLGVWPGVLTSLLLGGW